MEIQQERFADYFNSISREYQPLKKADIPTSYDEELPRLSEGEVIERINKRRNPNSQVPADIHPSLYRTCAKSVAIPATNNIMQCQNHRNGLMTGALNTYVTIIPKKTSPHMSAGI